MLGPFDTRNLLIVSLALVLALTAIVVGCVHGVGENAREVQARVAVCRTIEDEALRVTCIKDA